MPVDSEEDTENAKRLAQAAAIMARGNLSLTMALLATAYSVAVMAFFGDTPRPKS